MRLFPAIDLLGGKAVRLEEGKRDSATVFHDDPVHLVASLAHRDGRLLGADPGSGGAGAGGTAPHPAPRRGRDRLRQRSADVRSGGPGQLRPLDCVQRLRGPEGSIVSMQVDRGGKSVDLSIVRRNFSR